ncbi:MAG: class I SAM-dependent methyltransferase [Nitrososphaerota archaeon]
MHSDRDRIVQTHYSVDPEALHERILASLQYSGKNPDALTVEDLAPIDQFHTGGVAATRALLGLADLHPDMRVVDVGGGLGGSARLLAATIHCHVTVLDLTEAYCRAGEMLTDRLGLSDRVVFYHGNALSMPFASESFDVAWLQNASMNIADKERLFREIHRVLEPGGRLVMQDIMAGPVQPIHFPVPWADNAATSFLSLPEQARSLLRSIGFAEVSWVEVPPKPPAQANLENQSAGAGIAPVPLGFQVFLGERYPEMARNSVRNRLERRTVMIQAVFDRR